MRSSGLVCFFVSSMLWHVTSADPLRVPVPTLRGSLGACPSESQLSQAKQLLQAAVFATLDSGSIEEEPCNIATCCQDLPLNASTGYHCMHVSTYLPATRRFCDFTKRSPLASCLDLPSDSPSGYYWLQTSSDQEAQERYCNVRDSSRPGNCGDPTTWTRVAFLNMSDPAHSCPEGWSYSSSPVRTCRRERSTPNSCTSLQLNVSLTTYSQVCGRIRAYHHGASDGFNINAANIEGAYLDGLSLTHGAVNSRQHVWSFVSAIGEVGEFYSTDLCPCSNGNTWPYSLPFNSSNYFCDTGNHNSMWSDSETYYNDPLWDGQGCGLQSTCCRENTAPWFRAILPAPTSDDLELRTCHFYIAGYDTLVELIEIYVQ